MVYLLLGTGFEEMEAIAPLDILRRAGIPVMTVGLNGKTIYGGQNIGVEADITIDEMDLTDLEMIILPGGLGGVTSARACQSALDALKFAWITANSWQPSAQVLPFWLTWASLTARTLPATPAAKAAWAALSWQRMLPLSGTAI